MNSIYHRKFRVMRDLLILDTSNFRYVGTGSTRHDLGQFVVRSVEKNITLTRVDVCSIFEFLCICT